MKKWVWMMTVLIGLVSAAAQAEVIVTNLVVAQRPGTKLVDITYDVACSVTNKVKVSLSVSNGKAAVNAPSVSGAVGAGVVTGLRKTITWNMGVDWTATVASLAFSVRADVVPVGGDPLAVSWLVVSDRWVRNSYANGHITMSDLENNRMWTYNANPIGSLSWYQATNYCAELVYGGHSDWQQPHRDVLRTMASAYSQQGYFINVMVADYIYYWTGMNDVGGTAYRIHLNNGGTRSVNKTEYYCVWPVRFGL